MVKYEYLPAKDSCLVEPPPALEPLQLAGPESGCPDKWVACLDVDAGLALERNLRHSRLWAMEAWARCSPVDAGSPDGGTR